MAPILSKLMRKAAKDGMLAARLYPSGPNYGDIHVATAEYLDDPSLAEIGVRTTTIHPSRKPTAEVNTVTPFHLGRGKGVFNGFSELEATLRGVNHRFAGNFTSTSRAEIPDGWIKAVDQIIKDRVPSTYSKVALLGNEGIRLAFEYEDKVNAVNNHIDRAKLVPAALQGIVDQLAWVNLIVGGENYSYLGQTLKTVKESPSRGLGGLEAFMPYVLDGQTPFPVVATEDMPEQWQGHGQDYLVLAMPAGFNRRRAALNDSGLEFELESPVFTVYLKVPKPVLEGQAQNEWDENTCLLVPELVGRLGLRRSFYDSEDDHYSAEDQLNRRVMEVLEQNPSENGTIEVAGRDKHRIIFAPFEISHIRRIAEGMYTALLPYEHRPAQ